MKIWDHFENIREINFSGSKKWLLIYDTWIFFMSDNYQP